MRDYLKRVLELARPYRSRLVLGLVCGFLAGALSSTLPLSLKLAVDSVFAAPGVTNSIAVASTPAPTSSVSQPATLPAPTASSKQSLASRLPAPLKMFLDRLVQWVRPPEHPSRLRLALVIAFIPASMFLSRLLIYLNVYFLSWVGIRAANDLRVRLFNHLVNMPLGFYSSTSTGDLMTRIEGAMGVNSTIKDTFGVIIREPVTILVLVGTLIGLQPVLSLFTLLLFPVCLVPVVIFGRKFRKSDHGIHGRLANLNKVMHESFTGIRVIKGYNLESFVVEEFRKATAGVISFFMRSVRAGELPGPLMEFIGSLGVALVFAYYAFVPSAEKKLVGDMFAYFLIVFSLYAPFKNLSRLQHQLALAQAGVDPAYQLLAIQSTLPEPAHPKPLQAQGAVIRFDNVSFSYGEKAVLHDINLQIQPGQMVALVGRTGSGKTSLANLLLRFYDPQSGAVLIGNTDIREVSSRELRANMAVVTQQTILFNDTIRRNIALGRPGASDAEIEEAARYAYAHEFIAEKPKGYESRTGEKGVNLSGGQQQRLAIARAILKNAPILILDEATSALDTESEGIVQTALEKLMQGRTTICIAHRLSTIQRADMIVVLDGGHIVETGTHEQLLQARGLYSRLYELPSETGPG